MKDKVLSLISERINENKFEKIRLRPFIESDKLKSEELELIINELQSLYDSIYALYEN